MKDDENRNNTPDNLDGHRSLWFYCRVLDDCGGGRWKGLLKWRTAYDALRTITVADQISARHATVIVTVLKTRFPWLGSDEDVSGADTVSELNDLVETLEAISRRRHRPGSRTGGVRKGSGRPVKVKLDRSAIIDMRKRGMSWAQIAEDLGVSKSTAQRAAK